MNKKSKPAVFESPDITAFVSLYCGVNPHPIVNEKNRVVFEFDQDTNDAVRAFYANAPTPIADYCSKLKMIRSMIFSLKAGAYGKR